MITIYDTLGDAWKSNIGPTINSIPSDAFFAQLDSDGKLDIINQASKDMAGGLVSENLAVPAGAKFFGLDVIFLLSADDRPHFARGENDLKVTFPGGAQANFSTQWNDDKQMWQLDPTGATWADSGYTKPVVVGRNKWQVRGSFDGAKWAVTGLRFNDDTPFTPDPAKFANLPAIRRWRHDLGAPAFTLNCRPKRARRRGSCVKSTNACASSQATTRFRSHSTNA
jgi:hypothetical protein